MASDKDHRAEATTATRGKKRQRGDMETSSTLGRRKVACQTCRNRKVKCDLKRPICSLCAAADNECVYVTDPPKQTLESVAETLTGRLDHVTKQLDDLKAAVQANNSQLPSLVHASSHDSSLLKSPPVPGGPVAQSSRDFSHIPPHRTTADTVLTWPIFGGRFEPNHLIQPLLCNPDVSDSREHSNSVSEKDNYALTTSIGPLEDERIPTLVDSFLLNVHTKNPVLDVETLIVRGREASTRGLGYDAHSCIILLACALGCIAKPFQPDAATPKVATSKELQMGEQCFVLACRRLGLLKQTVLAAQCHFFAGVYLMYTLRPMLSWQHFHQASTTYQLYLKTNGRLIEHMTVVEQGHNALQPGSAQYRKQARLEQRLYWSCFKSEAEFRVELPLPQSELADYEYPRLFPSPPSPPSPHQYEDVDGHTADEHSSHALNLHNDEAAESIRQTESWYYYLTEVALRRIGNRIINTFFAGGHESWTYIEPYLDIAVEFEAQVSSWYANLPPAMQRYETNSTIKAPQKESAGGVAADHVSRELSWATENRLLEMRSWLYQPFLYYLVHVKPLAPTQGMSSPVSFTSSGTYMGLSPEGASVYWSFIQRGIECNLTILDTRTLTHRHHGLWYDLRASVCASFILLATVRAGYTDLIPGGLATLVGTSPQTPGAEMQRPRTSSSGSAVPRPSQVGGKLGKVLDQLRFWSDEAPEMIRHADVLEGLILEMAA
ncbi:uncharacterized protein AB675_11831 [Cyphellophora attinorum]|uniref:Zn(2)-C6 fungal-type domain-containing protein n=1 Tax=Cyphellophora attinorum TaxID=1664694 RepID=A0A0N1H6B5_9EURO|nr:uncharacterized protein AB675_11831 [Phialophora attinorum]KPI36833.1 hypothetical protein AB675_11831 [Phialophora attinorum]